MSSAVLTKNNNKIGIINSDTKLYYLINPNSNIELSNNTDIFIDIFLEYLEEYELKFRKSLDFKKTTTFGHELEFENAHIETIKKYLRTKNDEWYVMPDPSLKKGGEIPTPILKDSERCWKEIKEIIDFINDHATIEENCGGHIHVGHQVLGDSNKAILNFLKLWATYEHVIYRFAYGKETKPRNAIKEYAKPISNKFWETYHEFKDDLDIPKEEIIKKVSIIRNIGASLKYLLPYERPDIDTIEFRCPNGSLDPIIWQNNTNVFVKMLYYCKSNSFNNEIIDLRHEKRKTIYSILDNYSDFYLKDALEFADLIFNNNTDKIYFLKQYVKEKNVRK